MSTTNPSPPVNQSTPPPPLTQPQSRPPVTIHPTAHLDPGAYVRGTHAISLSTHTLIHPRAQLISIHGPLIIDSGTVVCEKAVLGGPVPFSSSATSTESKDADDGEDPVKTLVASNISIQPHAQIHAGATLLDSCIIESHAIVQRGVRIGAHAKVCAGCVVDRDVGEWEVVFGDGRQRRKRVVVGVDGDAAENARLKALDVDREITMGILKTATRASAARKK